MVPHLGPFDTHGVFVALGVLAATLLWIHLARERGPIDERLYVVVAAALVGGAIFMRMGTWAQHLDLRDNASFTEQWLYGNRSILGGLLGAWLGVHIGKRIVGYRERTGDLFAAPVALGMAIGRIGCYLTEPLATAVKPTYNISFLYEIAFHLIAFVAIWCWLRRLPLPSGETFVFYVAGYGVFRFFVEFVRGNEVAWHGLTRPQIFLAVTVPLILLRIAVAAKRGRYQAAIAAVRQEVTA